MTVAAPRIIQDPDKVVAVDDLLPWTVTDLPVRPYRGMWGFNPSIHFDGKVWRCMVRCADYAMPRGMTIRGEGAQPTLVQSKNALVELDPKTWRVTKTHTVRELDGLPRFAGCRNTGFEDVRLFRTATGGLQGIAASLHLDRTGNVVRGGSWPPEQVLLSFDEAYDVIDARPLRGAWSGQSQKNWVPFDGADEPRFVYSIGRGIVHDVEGPIFGAPEPVVPVNPQPKVPSHGGTEVKLSRRAISISAGKTLVPTYDGLRGGSQLIRVSDEHWLGIGHEMRFVQNLKWYYHSFFLMTSEGVLAAKSDPIKLYPERGIEFAAGMALDGDRLVISFGVDDMHCKIGETSLEAVLGALSAPPEVT